MWLSSDQAFAEFLESRQTWRVEQERVTPIKASLLAAYDRETEAKLMFIRGQYAADEVMERRTA